MIEDSHGPLRIKIPVVSESELELGEAPEDVAKLVTEI